MAAPSDSDIFDCSSEEEAAHPPSPLAWDACDSPELITIEDSMEASQQAASQPAASQQAASQQAASQPDSSQQAASSSSSSPSPRPGGSQQVACCSCARVRGRARASVCLQTKPRCRCASAVPPVECGEGCGCAGGCRNGRLVERRARVDDSTIPGAGRGCFATRALRVGDLVGEYRGEVMPEPVAAGRRHASAYLTNLNAAGTWVVDGQGSSSAVTRANHSEDPNSEFVERLLRVEGNTRLAKAMFLKASKHIEEGEEVLVNYGPGYPTNFGEEEEEEKVGE